VKHVIRPSANDDILRQFRYYLLEEAFEAATRFLDAVDESIEAICQMPEIGAPKQFKNPVLAGLRSWAVKGFEDILIFYVVQPDALRVVRVLHGRRDINKILEREKDDEAHQ
jgi:toxin ParE1/3/4